jgi:hypothetical protein
MAMSLAIKKKIGKNVTRDEKYIYRWSATRKIVICDENGRLKGNSREYQERWELYGYRLEVKAKTH